MLKKNKIKTMNSKMAINTYLSTIETKNTNEANKKNRGGIMDMESILMVARWEGGVADWVKR